MSRREKAPEPVYIIKAEEPIIPWDKLTEEERTNLLSRELGDVIFKRRDFIRTIRVLSELFTETNRREELQRIFQGLSDNETINFLLSVNWIIPIVNDVELVLNVTRERKNVKVVSRDFWQKKVSEVGPVGDLTDAVKPFENIDAPGGMTFRAGSSRFGIRNVDLDTMIKKGKFIPRVIAENETITIVGFVMDLNRIVNDTLIFDQSYKNLNFVQIFRNQFELKGVNFVQFSTHIPEIMNRFLMIEDLRRFSKNTLEFNERQLHANMEVKQNVLQVKEFIPESLIYEREIRVPTWLLTEPDAIKNIYGPYNAMNTLADLAEQRELWTTRSYVGNIPFYLLVVMLEILKERTLVGSIEDKVNKVVADYQENYVFLEAAMVAEESTWASKIRDFIKKEDIKFYVDLLIGLLRRFNKLLDKAVLYQLVKRHETDEIAENKDRARRRDTYEQAISEQLSPFVLEKLKEEAKTKAVAIEETLTTKQRKLVETYIQQILTLRKNYETNKCPHFKLRKQYDNLVSLDEKMAVFQRMITTFGPKAPDPETRYLFCKNCHFNMGCQHEVILMERYANRNREEELTKLLEDEYYGRRVAGPTAEFIACKYCGRKITEAAIEEQIAFDEDGIKITGVFIEREDDEIIMLRNLATSVLINASLQGAINSRKLIDEIHVHILDRWAQLERQQLSTEDTELLKKLFAVAYIYAKIIKDMIASGFRFRFRKEYMPENLPRDTINPYILAVLKITRDRDRAFFEQLGFKNMKVKFSGAIKNAFDILQKETFKKDIATFALARRIWGAKWTIDMLLKNADSPEKIRKSIKGLNVKSLHAVYEVLFEAVKARLNKIRELFKKPVQDPRWNDVVSIFDNYLLNTLFSVLVYDGIPRGYNRRYLKYTRLRLLEVPKKDPYFYYTLENYCDNGTPQNWDLTELFNNGVRISIKSSELKRKLKEQKTAFDMNYNPALMPIGYFIIDESVNITSINLFNRELINTKCNNITKSKAKSIERSRTSSDHRKLKEIVFEREELDEIADVITNACAGAPGQTIFWGIDIKCNGPPDKKILEKVQKALRVQKIEEVKNLPVLDIKKIRVPEDFKIESFNKSLANELIDKLLKLATKYFGMKSKESPSREAIMTFIIDLGKFKKKFEEQLLQVSPLLTPIERDARIKAIKKDQNWSRLAELGNVIRSLQRDYRLIRTSETDIFLNSPSLMYLARYIDEKKKDDFNVEIPAKYNVLSYYDIEYASDVGITQRVIMFLNIFVEIMNLIVKSRLSAEFALEFMSHVKENNELADTTDVEIGEIQTRLDFQRRKNTEKFLKMTPEEKVAKGFFEAGLEEQIELLNEESQRAATEEDERILKNYNERQDVDQFSQTLDDEQSYDDDDVFITDSFEVYQD